MLDIILGILKFIGILLAVILLLVVGILSAVLFAPVRYRGTVKRTKEHTGAEVKVTWLLHFISFYLKFDLETKRPVWVLKILGLTIDQILNGFKAIVSLPARLKRKRIVKIKKTDPVTKSSVHTSESSAEVKEEEDIDEDVGNGIDNEADDELEYDEPDSEPDSKSDIDSVIESVSEEIEKDIPDAIVDEGIHEYANEYTNEYTKDYMNEHRNECEMGRHTGAPEEQAEESAVQKKHFRERIQELGNKIKCLLQLFCDKIKDIYQKLTDTKKNIEQKIAGLQVIPEKIEYYLGMAEKYEAREVLNFVLVELFCMLSHYAPRKVTGYLHFGTGDPALTGELTGLLYVLLPARAATFRVEPEFTDKVFETEMNMKGRIRVCHLGWLAWKLFRNKKFMRLVKWIRNIRR